MTDKLSRESLVESIIACDKESCKEMHELALELREVIKQSDNSKYSDEEIEGLIYAFFNNQKYYGEAFPYGHPERVQFFIHYASFHYDLGEKYVANEIAEPEYEPGLEGVESLNEELVGEAERLLEELNKYIIYPGDDEEEQYGEEEHFGEEEQKENE